MNLQFRLFLFLTILVCRTVSLQCFDCYGTGPDHKECSTERTCHGVACMIFDAGDNKTASAFCLLAMKGQKMEEAKDGCWLEPDGKGKHCMCFNDFCNKLIDRRNIDETDPMAPLLPTAEFLKQNPLVDYDAPNLGDYVDDGAHPAPKHVLFPSADKPDPRIAGGNEDDDLVPVAFEDYKDEEISTSEVVSETTTLDVGVPLSDESSEEDIEEEKEKKQMSRQPTARDRLMNDRTENEISSVYKPPSWVLLLFPMAHSLARFVAAF